MKKLLLTAGLVLAASTAHAADTTESGPTAADWNGAYIGVNAGGGFGTFKHPINNLSFDVTAGGFLGGVQAGYNWQFGQLVYGVEADFQGSTVNGYYTQFNFVNTKVDWFGTLRGRIGYTPIDRILIYGTGGLAYGNVKTDIANGLFVSSKTKAGWTVGAGVEYAIDTNWTFKSEYLYTDFGRSEIVPGYENGVAFQTVRLGLNYKFDGDTFAPQELAPDASFFDWTGGYVGVNVGGGFGTFKHPVIGGGGTSFDLTAGGFLGGAQAGYNWESGRLVYGVETDLQASAIKGSYAIASPAANPAYVNTRVNWFGTLRARIGYAPLERIMIYGTGGLAYGQIRTDFDYGLYSSSETKAGWTIGAGIEYAINKTWAFKSEYLYTDFGESTIFPDISLKRDIAFHAVRVGLNYKF